MKPTKGFEVGDTVLALGIGRALIVAVERENDQRNTIDSGRYTLLAADAKHLNFPGYLMRRP